MALTAAEHKQIRDALCQIVVRGIRHEGELKTARESLTQQFEALKAAPAPQAAKEK